MFDSEKKLHLNEKLMINGKVLLQSVLNYGIYIAFILLVIILSVISPNFLSLSNFSNVLQQISVIGTIAIGMTFIIIARGIDVSVGAIVALGSCVGCLLMTQNHVTGAVAIVAIIIVCILASGVSGVGASYLGMPSFIVTLAMVNIARGLALSFSGGTSIFGISPLFAEIGNGSILYIPIPILIFIVCAIAGHIILSKTIFGKQVYAVGGNPLASRVSGISVNKIILGTFLISGFFVGIGSTTITARVNSFFPTVGTGYEFDAIAAVVIGGASLNGGTGWIGGTIIGTLIIGVINNALNLLNISAFYQDVIKGVIIFLAVLMDTLKTKKRT